MTLIPQMVGRPDHANVLLLDMQAMPMFERMQANGMLVDPAKLDELQLAITEEKRTQQDLMEAALGSDLFTGFNPASEDQIAKLLFEDLSLPNNGIKLTRSRERESVAKSELAKLAGMHPVIAPLQKWRECDTLEDVFVAKLPRTLYSDGRVRPRVLYTRTATGRPASKEPNLLNIPVRTELGKRVRDAFVAPKGKRLVSGDFGQIELRVLAHESQDAAMLRTCRAGGDIHETTRQRIFGSPRDEVERERQRKRAKNLVFGVLYGVTAMGYREQILVEGGDPDEWTEEVCQSHIDSLWGAYPGARARMDEYHRRIRRYGFIWDMWGRERPLSYIRSALPWIREQALRDGGNHPMQAGAAGIMKRAMVETWEPALAFGAEPLLQIYDQLLFEVDEHLAEDFADVLEGLMAHAVDLCVPIEVDVSMGDNWGQL